METKTVSAREGVPEYQVSSLKNQKNAYALVIPVINEGFRLKSLLSKIKSFDNKVDVIIADGGSVDGSTGLSILEELGVNTLLVKVGPGRLSAQLRMAIDYCLGQEYSAIITMDGNDKDGVEGISNVIEALNEGYEFVQGSRFISGGISRNTPIRRYLAIRLIHAPLTSVSSRYFYTDSTNGFRGMSRRLLSDPQVQPLRDVFRSYELLAYLPIRSAKLGYKVTEVPVTRTYPTNVKIPTKINGFRSHLSLFTTLLYACFGKFNPKL
jgi:dolichol-phosphate mannosyltransferase